MIHIEPDRPLWILYFKDTIFPVVSVVISVLIPLAAVYLDRRLANRDSEIQKEIELKRIDEIRAMFEAAIAYLLAEPPQDHERAYWDYRAKHTEVNTVLATFEKSSPLLYKIGYLTEISQFERMTLPLYHFVDVIQEYLKEVERSEVGYGQFYHKSAYLIQIISRRLNQ